jgi:two-component system response regulator MprA
MPQLRSRDRGPVLVVDDDDSIRSMLVDVLSFDGYRVVGARDGMEALAAIEREQPFVILLDLLMPLLDGRSFANVARDSGIDVPIVVMTASDAHVSRGVEADAYIAKPFDLPELLSTVARFDVVRGGAARHASV